MSDSPGGELPAAPASRATALEAAVVFGLCLGPSFVSQFTGDVEATAFTDAHLYTLVAFQVAVALVLVPWLWRRGWTPRAVAGSPEPLHVLAGIWLTGLTVGVTWIAWGTFSILQPALAEGMLAGARGTAPAAGTLAVVAVSVVNPIFEEFLWLGYGIHRLEPRLGQRGAIALSVLLRTAVHLYQGPWALLGILPLGLAFTWYYVRTRRLWPVVVAHLIFDAMGLAVRLE